MNRAVTMESDIWPRRLGKRVMVSLPLLGYGCIRPVDHIALLHFTHIEEDILPHLDVLAEGQVRHEQASAGALGPLDGQPLRGGVAAQGVGGLLQAGEVQGALQVGQLGGAVDVDQMVLVLEPMDLHGAVLLMLLQTV